MTRDQHLLNRFVKDVHTLVEGDIMPGDRFHRQMERLAHSLGAWDHEPVNFGPYGGKLVPPVEPKKEE